MNLFSKKLVLTSCFALYAMGSSIAVLGKDIEIFFRPPPADSPKPNVLFIMSTAGTMSGEITGPDDCDEPKKIGALKCVLRKIVDEEDGINFGLMRWTGPGGPVMYPVTPLTESIRTSTPVDKGVTNTGNDILQTTNTDSSITYTNNQTCTSGSSPTGCDSGQMVVGGSGTIAGFRFSDISIPSGATIDNAVLKLVTIDTNATPPEGIWNIHGEEGTGQPAEFDSTGLEDISGRLSTTSVPWIITTDELVISADEQSLETPIESKRESSPDISSLIQTYVNESDWCGNNSLNLYVQPQPSAATAERTIASFENSGLEPQLYIEWSGGEGGCMGGTVGVSITAGADDAEDVQKNATTTQLGTNVTALDLAVSTGTGRSSYPTLGIGLVFRDVIIPVEADTIIEEAYIEFEVKETDTFNYNMDITLINDPDYGDLVDRFSESTDTSATVNWSGNETWTVAGKVTTPNIASVIQEIIDNPLWSSTGGNTIPIVLKTVETGSTRRFLSADAGGSISLVIKYTGSPYTAPVSTTVKDEIKLVIDDYKAVSNQPVTETYLEAYDYYTGKPVNFGLDRGTNLATSKRISHPDSYQYGQVTYGGRNAVEDAALAEICAANKEDNDCVDEAIVTDGTGTGTPTYISPIDPSQQCQSNHIVILSDSDPDPFDPATRANTLTRFQGITGNNCDISGDSTGEQCAIDLAEYLAGNEEVPAAGDDPRIRTHFIQFGGGNENKLEFGQALAEAGDGEFYVAESGNELVEAFTTLIENLKKVDTSFVSAGITVNQSNRLTHRDELYFSLFRPESSAIWPGNVKRYRIVGGSILDVNGNEAVTGDIFKDESQSWWSGAADGNDAGIGGAASQLNFTDSFRRKTFSNLYGSTNITASGTNLVDLTNIFTFVDQNNSLFAVSDQNDDGSIEDEVSTVLSWIMGFNADGTTHNIIGDPLHSKPTILTYRGAEHARTITDSEGNEVTTNERDMVVVGTNLGFLHGFETNTGSEVWSFIPRQLLSNITTYFENDILPPSAHNYGVDGSIAIYIDDANGDGAIDVDDSDGDGVPDDRAYLYVGLRRGSSTAGADGKPSYFAFDVTDHDEPELLFIINNITEGFEGIGETWSKPVISKLANTNGAYTDSDGVTKFDLVMYFGGGYDTQQDPDPDMTLDERDSAPQNSTVGNNVYMVNATTGELIWDAMSNAQQHPQAGLITDMSSVPGDVKAIDPRKPGYLEHMYVADTAGQIFRFDFDTEWDGTDADTLAKGGKLAETQDPSTDVCANTTDPVDCNRRFFYSPDVAIVPRPRGLTYISVALGSGHRAHPLGLGTSDKFFAIRDIGVLQREVETYDTGSIDENGDPVTGVRETGFSEFNNQDSIDGSSEVITLDNLLDVTDDVAGDTSLTTIEGGSDPDAPTYYAGWFIRMEKASGEKVLAESITFNNRIIFTTYLAPTSSVLQCAPTQGTGRAYAVNIIDGSSPFVNNDGTVDPRYVDLDNIGIPPEPQVIILGDGPQLLIGRQIKTDLINVDWGEIDRIKWRERKSR